MANDPISRLLEGAFSVLEKEFAGLPPAETDIDEPGIARVLEATARRLGETTRTSIRFTPGKCSSPRIRWPAPPTPWP